MKKSSFSLYEREKNHASIRGFSAIEAIIAMALVALIAVVIAPMFTAVNRAWDKDKRLKEQVQVARDAMDFMIHELKKTNGIIDGKYDPDFVGTSTLSESYVVFSTGGEEYYLDNRNSGYQMDTSSLFKVGTAQGGFAGDYDGTATGIATYSFSTMTTLPGAYDLYAYFISTGTTDINTSAVSVSVYDDANTDISSTFCQGPGNASKWYKVCDSDTATADCDATRVDFSETSQYRSIRAACFGAKPPCTAACATYNSIVDGFKLVYKGQRHKVFNYDSATNKITFGDDNPDDVVDNDDTVAQLSNNPTLIDNVAPLTSTTSIFTYWKADGVSPVDSGGNPGEVALVRIAFQLIDPQGKVPPYELRGQAEIRSAGSGSQNKIVINEINYAPQNKKLAQDNFDGNSTGWATSYAGTYIDWVAGDGWISIYEDFEDQEDPDDGTAPHVPFAADQHANVNNIADGGRVMSITKTGGAAASRNNVIFLEESGDYALEVRFRATAGDDDFMVYGFYGGTNDYIRVQFFNTGGTDTMRLEVTEGGATNYFINIQSVNAQAYDDTLYHTVKIIDTWRPVGAPNGVCASACARYGQISLFLDDVQEDADCGVNDVVNDGICQYHIDDMITGAPDYIAHTKAFSVKKDDVVYIDHIKLVSFDYKPVAYLTDFEGDVNSWQTSNNPDGGGGGCAGGAVPWTWGDPTVALSTDFDHTPNRSTSDGIKAYAAGNYPWATDQDLYSRPIEMNGFWSMPSVYFWTFIKLPAGAITNRDAGIVGIDGDNDGAYDFFFAEEGKMFDIPPDDAALGGTTGIESPAIYDGTNTDIFDCAAKDAWTMNHTLTGANTYWTRVRLEGTGNTANNNIFDDTSAMLHFRFASNSTDLNPEPNYGFLVDDVEVYPGGLWVRREAKAAFQCASPLYCIGMNVDLVGGADYPNYVRTAVETPAVVVPVGATGVSLSWKMLVDTDDDNAGAPENFDGGIVEYSSDNGTTWIQIPSENLTLPYDDVLDSTTGNELGGKEAYCYDNRSRQGSPASAKFDPVTANIFFDNELTAAKTFRFRFQFAANSATGGRGWRIDDVTVGLTSDVHLEYVELYNPNPYPIDIDTTDNNAADTDYNDNYQLVTESHTGSGDEYDVIVADFVAAHWASGAVPANPTLIPAYGYAIITDGSTKVFNDAASANPSPYYNYLITGNGQNAIRLTLRDSTTPASLDSFFGYRGLRNEYGKITLKEKDPAGVVGSLNGPLVDYVGYNLVFYDDMENADVSYFNFSTGSNTADPTYFKVVDPAAAAPGTSLDYTKGKYGTGGGKAWLLYDSTGAGTQEAYTTDDETQLILPSLDLTEPDLSTYYVHFAYFLSQDTGGNLRDGGIVEASLDGGSQFDYDGPFTNQIGYYSAQRTDLISLAPKYDGVVSALNRYAYGRNRPWREVTGRLAYWNTTTDAFTNYDDRVIMLRFFFASDANATEGKGWYIDDVAVYSDWGGGNTPYTIERSNWSGSSSKKANWLTSTNAVQTIESTQYYATPGYKNSAS